MIEHVVLQIDLACQQTLVAQPLTLISFVLPAALWRDYSEEFGDGRFILSRARVHGDARIHSFPEDAN